MTLRVGFNLAYLVEDSGGSGTYARELLPHLLVADPSLKLTAWIGTTAPAGLLAESWASEVRWIRLPVPGIGSPWHLWHELAGIGLDARRRHIDLVHGLAYLAPVIHPGVIMVTTILDVIWSHHAEATDWRFRTIMGTLAPAVGRSAARVLTISEAARDDIAATLKLDLEKCDVTPLGIRLPPPRTPPDPAEIADRLGLGSEPVVLCVAAKRHHKNLHGLIRAIAHLPEPRPQLVMPGSSNAYEEHLRALSRELGVERSVRFPGWVSDADLEDLYAVAACLVLPTFDEGFGLPVLEAMARGVPVACSDIRVLAEVAGSAALLFDPHQPVSIANTISRLLDDVDLAERMRTAGLKRCSQFTWERTARLTLESYRRACDAR